MFNGKGIPQGRAKVLEPLVRLYCEGDGTGLGLATCSCIAATAATSHLQKSRVAEPVAVSFPAN